MSSQPTLELPPADLVGVSTGSYNADDIRNVSHEFLGYFKNIGQLAPDGAVLDVGCGVGRMVIGLSEYLSPSGMYRGFDVNKNQIDWCREKVTPLFPNFQFEHVDVGNTTYNTGGAVGAESFTFPYEDETFDLVFMTSIFTHMMPAAVKRYLAETTRVLKPGGRSLITYFILDETSRKLVAEHPEAAEFTFPHDGAEGVYRVQVAERPEDVVAYHEDWLRGEYRSVGQQVVDPIRYGSWSGRPDPFSYQDIVVARKG